jgi:hypothetical protein
MSKLSWPRAVSEWNKAQIFRDDLYGIPKKGGEYYDEVKALMAGSRFETQVQTMMGRPASATEAPKPEPSKPEEKLKDTLKKIEDQIDGLELEKLGTARSLPGSKLSLNINELEKAEEIDKKLKDLREGKTPMGKSALSVLQEQEIERKLLLRKIKKRHEELDQKLQKLRKEKSELSMMITEKAIEKTSSRIKSASEVLAETLKGETREDDEDLNRGPILPGAKPKPIVSANWRTDEAGYEDTRNVPPLQRRSRAADITNIPSDYSIEKGFDWLRNKYGKKYDDIVEKVKAFHMDKKGTMTTKQMKEYFRVSGVDIQEFLDDLAYADPAVYDAITFNVARKPGSKRRVVSEFLEFAKRK